MKCSQASILSRARSLKGVKAARLSAASQVLRLDKPDAEATFVGPVRLYVSHVKSALMPSVKTAGLKKSVDVEAWRREIFIPSGHQFSLLYKDLIGEAEDGCVVVTAADDDEPTQTTSGDDLPCDFAVAALSPNQYIFPPSCEPCESGVVNAPPSCGQAIPIPVATGGCIRPRFFNGMFITREDMETQLRYMRVKQRLQNRAMGEGVVWGFPLLLDGTRIRVGAGYGVDCCGNDLTVTCDYQVSTETLLSDPELCGKLEECASLVLEYVECQENPRPVHGEACGQATPACEMSRVRETVRLRLKPKCDDAEHTDPVAQAFDKLLGIIRPETPTSSDTTTETWRRVPATESLTIPWELQAMGPDIGGGGPVAITLQARHDSPQQAWIPVMDNGQQVNFEFAGTSGATFTEITVEDSTGVLAGPVSGASSGPFTYTVPADIPTTPHTYEAQWEIEAPTRMRSAHLTDEPTQVTAEVPERETTYQARFASPLGASMDILLVPTSGASPPAEGQYLRITILLGTTSIVSYWRITTVITEGTNFLVTAQVHGPMPTSIDGQVTAARLMHVKIGLSVAVEVPSGATTPDTPPCCADPCCSHGHALDPNDRLLILVLTLYYARILQEIAQVKARQKTATTTAATAGLASVARTLLTAMLPDKLIESSATLNDFDEAARELYRVWYCHALYLGPSCDCGCGCSHENRGIVIGCAYFRAGKICHIDARDGRRWVLHPPLLQHWASAFGFPALDQTVMSLFSRLCCIRALPSFGSDFRADQPAGTVPSADTAAPRAVAFTPSARFSVLPNMAEVARPIDTMSASFTLAGADDDQDCQRSFLASLLRLVLAIEAVSPAALVDNVNRFLCHPLCGLGRLPLRQRTPRTMAAVPVMTRAWTAAATETPSTLRDTGADLAATLLAHTSTSSLRAAAPIRETLAGARVRTIPDLLLRSPQTVLRIAGAQRVKEVNAAYREAEALPEQFASAVAKTFAHLDKEGATTAADWTSDEARHKLERELKKRLTVGAGSDRHLLIDEESLRAALDEWAAAIKRQDTPA